MTFFININQKKKITEKTVLKIDLQIWISWNPTKGNAPSGMGALAPMSLGVLAGRPDRRESKFVNPLLS